MEPSLSVSESSCFGPPFARPAAERGLLGATGEERSGGNEVVTLGPGALSLIREAPFSVPCHAREEEVGKKEETVNMSILQTNTPGISVATPAFRALRAYPPVAMNA